jgi:hypothetical protein
MYTRTLESLTKGSDDQGDRCSSTVHDLEIDETIVVKLCGKIPTTTPNPRNGQKYMSESVTTQLEKKQV